MKKIFLILVTVLLVFGCTSVVAFAEDDVAVNVEDNAVDNIETVNAKLDEFYEIGDGKNFEVTSISIVADKESYVVINGKLIEEQEDSEETKDTPWSNKFALDEEQYLKLFHANESILVYEKESDKKMTEETAKILVEVIDNSKTNLDVKLDFKPAEFTRNIKYMGFGMLGIFAVVGVVILLTFVLNNATSKKH
ncbi:MAG: hypothetical protein J6Q89_02620 [Clostridia bacterium]|nr:hypothetical protein [Clostridia bacterium]